MAGVTEECAVCTPRPREAAGLAGPGGGGRAGWFPLRAATPSSLTSHLSGVFKSTSKNVPQNQTWVMGVSGPLQQVASRIPDSLRLSS